MSSREHAWMMVAWRLLLTADMHRSVAGGVSELGIEFRLELVATPEGEVATEIAPGVALEIGPVTLLSMHSGTGERRQADAGWTFFVARTESPPSVVAFYELYDHGVTVVVRGTTIGAIDAASERIDAVLRSADIDRTQTEVVALSQLLDMA